MGILEPVCEACRRQTTHATCAVCRRHRKVAGQNLQGKYLCSDCSQDGVTQHACPVCSDSVPGAGLARCRSCSNRLLIHKDAVFVAAQIETEWVRQLWNAFVEERLDAASAKPGLRQQMSHAAEFFRVLESSAAQNEPDDPDILLANIDSRFARKHLLASRFVAGRIASAELAKQRGVVVEHRRIRNILDRSRDHSFHALLKSYAEYLASNRLSVRTVRLYLRAAEAFCLKGNVNASEPWTNETLATYLNRSKGHAASLGRFVTYCRMEQAWDVQMPLGISETASIVLRRQVKDLQKLLQKLEALDSSAISTKMLGRLFSLSFGLPAAQLIRERRVVQLAIQEDGQIQIMDNASIGPSDALHRYALRWVELSGKNIKAEPK